MGNCLVTKLKGVVNNDNLVKLGVIRLKSNNVNAVTSEEERKLGITVSGPATISIVENGFYFKTQGDPNPATERSRTINNTTVWLVFTPGEFTIEITNKYAITLLSTGQSARSVISIEDLSDFQYCSGLTYLHNAAHLGNSIKAKGDISCLKDLPISSLNLDECPDITGDLESLRGKNNMAWLYFDTASKIEGDIDVISNMIDLTMLQLPETSKISGDFASYGELTKLTSYQVMNMNITGSIEDFVTAQCNATNPRTSADGIFCNVILRFISFGGAIQVSHGWGFLGWESASKIYVLDGANNPNGCPYVTCKGYTQVEAETKWPGKTIIRVDA